MPLQKTCSEQDLVSGLWEHYR